MDRFQQLNFSQGVEAGDVALRNAYRVLRWILGPSNVAYFGSDCFAALLSYDDVETTTDLVGTALHRLARTDLSDRLTGVFATASAGVIVIDDPEATADGALYEAECLLLAAKDMGGNRVVIERLSRTYAGVESA
jgi:GGDEF domain-containing protein